MQFKEISDLRKSGNLELALEKAKKWYVEENTTEEIEFGGASIKVVTDQLIWAKRALSWVYYDYLKIAVEKDNWEDFIMNLGLIKDLELSKKETMLFDNCAWQIGKMLYKKASKKENQIKAWRDRDQIFPLIRSFHFSAPSESYSYLIKALLKVFKNSSSLVEIIEWWGLENFLPEDYQKSEYNGRHIMALVEQAYIAYSKALLMGKIIDLKGNNKLDLEKITDLMKDLDDMVKKYPEYQYLPYYKAKCLITLGEEKGIMNDFLPFARKKQKDFWVWELMSELFEDRDDRKIACYSKAMSVGAPEKFLVKSRIAFAEILIKREMYTEASNEIHLSFTERTNNGWKVPEKITRLMAHNWYAPDGTDNKGFYKKYASEARGILFRGIEEELIVVEFVNRDKKILNFVKDKKKHGFFKYPKHLKPKVGDKLMVRFKNDGDNGFYKIYTAHASKNGQESAAEKTFAGDLKLIQPHNFGFIDDVFVDPDTVQKHRLLHGQEVSGKAILSYNKKKGEWGWKARSLNLT